MSSPFLEFLLKSGWQGRATRTVHVHAGPGVPDATSLSRRKPIAEGDQRLHRKLHAAVSPDELAVLLRSLKQIAATMGELRHKGDLPLLSP